MKAIKILYIIFLFLFITGSRFGFGALTLQMIVAPLLFMLVLHQDGGFKADLIIKLYIVFVIFYGVSCLVTNHLEKFMAMFLRLYFIAIVAWSSTRLVISRCPKYVDYVVYIILGIGVFDVAVTLSQFTFNSSWYEPIENILRFPTSEDYENYLDILGGNDVFVRFMPGIFGNAVVNGYYTALCSSLSMQLIVKHKNVFLYIIPLYFLIGCFVCQERSALAIAVVLIVYMTYRSLSAFSLSKKMQIIFAVCIALVYGVAYFVNMSENYGMRYSSLGTDDTGRSVIWKQTLEYISENPIFPNFDEAVEYAGHAPHNLFLNAFIYGGFVSFMCIMVILFKQSKVVYNIIKDKWNEYNITDVSVALTWLGFTLNSLVHNRSIVTGETIVWILWALIQTKYEIRKKSNKTC